MRRAAKRDTNHNEIFDVFYKLLSAHVTDTSKWGDGAGDLFVSVGKVYRFIEIKRDDKAEYTAHQIRFQNAHPGAVIRCESVTQAIEICRELRKLAMH